MKRLLWLPKIFPFILRIEAEFQNSEWIMVDLSNMVLYWKKSQLVLCHGMSFLISMQLQRGKSFSIHILCIIFRLIKTLAGGLVNQNTNNLRKLYEEWNWKIGNQEIRWSWNDVNALCHYLRRAIPTRNLQFRYCRHYIPPACALLLPYKSMGNITVPRKGNELIYVIRASRLFISISDIFKYFKWLVVIYEYHL